MQGPSKGEILVKVMTQFPIFVELKYKSATEWAILYKQLLADAWCGNSKYKTWPSEYGPIIIPEHGHENDATKCMLVPS